MTTESDESQKVPSFEPVDVENGGPMKLWESGLVPAFSEWNGRWSELRESDQLLWSFLPGGHPFLARPSFFCEVPKRAGWRVRRDAVTRIPTGLAIDEVVARGYQGMAVSIGFNGKTCDEDDAQELRMSVLVFAIRNGCEEWSYFAHNWLEQDHPSGRKNVLPKESEKWEPNRIDRDTGVLQPG
jgi:hypothetical protein